MNQVIGIGETILDIIFRNNQPQQAVPGGSTFNCMISLARCGVPALFVSELGKDKTGQLIASFMEENGLSSRFIHFYEDGQSPVALAFLDENQNAEYVFYTRFPEKRLDTSFPEINANDWVVFGSYFAVNPVLREKVREWLAYARSKNAGIYYDINFRRAHAAGREQLMPAFIENFQFSDIIRCSNEDLEVLFPGKSIEEIYKQYFLPFNKTWIVTRGDQPALLKTPALEKEYPVQAVEAVSTIGAGDNFNAGILYGLAKNRISRSEIQDLDAEKWKQLIGYAQTFAAEVCLSLNNYVSYEFCKTI